MELSQTAISTLTPPAAVEPRHVHKATERDAPASNEPSSPLDVEVSKLAQMTSMSKPKHDCLY